MRYKQRMDYRSSQGNHDILVVAFNAGVFGLDAANGKEKWMHKVPGTAIRLVITDTLVFAAGNDAVLCIEYLSGDLVWRVKRRHFGTGTLLLQGERLFVSSAGEVECLSLSGEPLWDEGFKGRGYGAIALGTPNNVIQGDQDR